jgi:hypothetical protein
MISPGTTIAPRNSPALEDLQELEQEEEIPLGAGRRVGQRRIGRGAELGPEVADVHRLPREHRPQGRHEDHAEHHRHHREHRHGVLEHLIGPEHRVGLRDRLFRVESVLAEKREMHDEHHHERPRQEAGMEREKPRQRVVAVLAAADDQLLDRRPGARHDPREIGGHDRGPVALLVPGQQIARQRHAEHQHHQDEPEPEIHLSGRAVSPVDHHLQQMQREQDDHRLGHEVVDAAEQPAAGHLVLDVVDALPGGLGARRIARPEEEPRDHLREKREDQRAAPDIPPAGPAGHPLVEGLVNEGPVAGAVVEEVGQTAERALRARATAGGASHAAPLTVRVCPPRQPGTSATSPRPCRCRQRGIRGCPSAAGSGSAPRCRRRG